MAGAWHDSRRQAHATRQAAEFHRSRVTTH